MAKTYTAAGSAVAGDVYTAAAHNVIVTDVNNFIVPPMCRMVLTSPRGITANTHTSITFNTDMREDYDTDGMLATAAGSKITVQTAGIYSCTAAIGWGTSSVGTRFARIYRVRSGTEIAFAISEVPAHPAGVIDHSLAGMIECNAGDTIELGCFQSTAGLLNVIQEGAYQTTFLAVKWIGRTS